MDRDVVTIVSGLPRSGTSMMMKMLEAGGIELLIDRVRVADADNPKGYYEFERVKQIETDQAWLPEAQGKAVKMISALLRHLPADCRYRIIFMERRHVHYKGRHERHERLSLRRGDVEHHLHGLERRGARDRERAPVPAG